MQLAGKLSEPVLNGVKNDARRDAHWLAQGLTTAWSFIARGIGALMGLASIAAIAIVGVLSAAFYGLVLLLARIPPVRRAHLFLSGTYDGMIAWLGAKILQDQRDAPALRLMVSLTLTTVPIFITQLILGKPRIWLAILFYLSLCGPKFQRSVRMFSSKHLEAHRPRGYFSEKYEKIFGRYVEFFLGYFYGDLPELGRTVHVRLHHKENGGFDDNASTLVYDRTSPLDFFRYLSGNIWTALGIAPYAYFRARGDKKSQSRMFWGITRYAIYFTAVFLYDWRIGVVYVLVPLFAMNFIMAITSWVQHAFCDPENPEDYFVNTVTVYDDVNFMNEGYHLAHHHRSGLHWSEMPAHMEKLRDKMRESGSLVFRDMDFMELFIELTLLRRMDVLAEKLVPWQPMSHKDKMDLLVKRTKPVAIPPLSLEPVAQ